MTTGDGYTLEGFLAVGGIIALVFLVVLTLTLIGQGTHRVAGLFPSIKKRTQEEAGAHAAAGGTGG